MALDSSLAVRWVIDTLRADSTFTDLLGDQQAIVYRDVASRDAPLPAAVVSHAATGAAPRPLKTGANTQTLTAVTVKLKIMAENEYADSAINRAIVVLDGKVYQSYDNGNVYECVKGTDLQYGEEVGDVFYKHTDVFWELRAKA